MRIGIPAETRIQEGRVALTPAAVSALVQQGHPVLIQSGAGVIAGFSDKAYQDAGATLCVHAQMVYESTDLVVKVKEPQPDEALWLQSGQLLFCYLHLAAVPALLATLVERNVSALAFETLMLNNGTLPLLAPMSRIAGALAVQLGSVYLSTVHGGKGRLLAAMPGTRRTRVVVLGGGVAGTQAALLAAQMGAHVTVLDRNPAVWMRLGDSHPALTVLGAEPEVVQEAVRSADLLIGAVLLPGAKAPKLVLRSWVAAMQPGSVIVDISVDQGGCIETTHPTTHAQPVYVEEGVLHCAVTNLPGIVAQSSTLALSGVVLPYVEELAGAGTQWLGLSWVSSALNVHAGSILHPALLELH